MKINSISANYINKTQSFKCNHHSAKPLIDIPEDAKNDDIVAYSTWGNNYAFPITAGQLKEQQQTIIKLQTNKPNVAKVQTTKSDISEYSETPEEYYRRKINSPDWGAY